MRIHYNKEDIKKLINNINLNNKKIMKEKFRIIETSKFGNITVQDGLFDTYSEAVEEIKINLTTGMYNIEKVFIKN